MGNSDTHGGTGVEGVEGQGVEEQGHGRDRRSVLRAGVIGAAWAVPAVTMIGVSPASADNPSGPPVVTEPPTVEPTETPVDKPTVEPTNVVSTPPVESVPPPVGTQAAPVRAVAAAQAPAAAPQSLAFTGADTGVAAAVAAGLVLGGTALSVASRKGKEQGAHTD